MTHLSEEELANLLKELDEEQESRANFTPYKAVLKEKNKVCTVIFCDSSDVCEIVIDFEESIVHTMLENLIPWNDIEEQDRREILLSNR